MAVRRPGSPHRAGPFLPAGVTGTGGAPGTRPWAEDRLQRAHKASIFNRKLVASSSRCGCFYCLASYPTTEVVDWCDPRPMPDWTALCPLCGMDSVLPDAAGFELTAPFLEAMQARWFHSLRSPEKEGKRV